jgi:hypothetical protein
MPPRRFNELICKNCTISGHSYKECPFPVMSFGIICYYIDSDYSVKYLMIQRKNTLAFMEFLKGRYNMKNDDYLKKLINNMTQEEKKILYNNDFETIWTNVWLEASNKNIKEYFESKEKFNKLLVERKIQKIIDNSINLNIQPEWGFPKGRRKVNETDLQCAIREFCEETQFKIEDIKIEFNNKSFVEIFYGTNDVLYKHSYYLAKLVKNDNSLFMNPNFLQQIREIRDLKWCDSGIVLHNIGGHNRERSELFNKINLIVEENLKNEI